MRGLTPFILSTLVVLAALGNARRNKNKLAKPKSNDYARKQPQWALKELKRLIKEKTGRGYSQLGDVIMTKDQFEDFRFGPAGTRSYTTPKNIWNQNVVNGRIRIAYKVDWDSWSRSDQDKLMRILPEVKQDFYEKTAIEYGEWGSTAEWRHEHWIMFTARSRYLGGCSSLLGRIGDYYGRPFEWGKGEQQISLQGGCLYKNTIIHELLHSLGWTHEQNRPDRDDYIEVRWDNIPSSMHSQFKKAERSVTHGSPYNIRSVMQYHSQAFTNNWDKFTMVSKDPSTPVMGYRESFDLTKQNGLSGWDRFEINHVYNLNAYCAKQGKEWALWDKGARTPRGGDSEGNAGFRFIGNNTCVGQGVEPPKINPCDSNPCRGAKVCIRDGDSYRCEGNDPCDSHRCQNKATCVASDLVEDEYSCKCQGYFYGQYCETGFHCGGAEGSHVLMYNGEVVHICDNFKFMYDQNRELRMVNRQNLRKIGGLTFTRDISRNVKVLKLNENDLEEIDSEAFGSITQLKNVQLHRNKLTKIDSSMFSQNPSLEEVNLSTNDLQKLDRSVFDYNPNLKKVYLQNNPDLEVSADMFDQQSQLKSVRIDNTKGNPKRVCQQLKRKHRGLRCCHGVRKTRYGNRTDCS